MAILGALVCSLSALAQTAGPSPLKLQTDLCAAISAGDADAVASALEHGARLDWECYEQKMTPIHHAVDTGNTAIVAMLLDRGANVNQEDNGVGATPLHYAAGSTVELVSLLAKRGANVNALTTDGLSPLAIAVLAGDHPDVVQALLDAGADVNAADEEGDTILDLAISKGHTQVAKLLEGKGAKSGEGAPVPASVPAPGTINTVLPAQNAPGPAGEPADGELVFKGLYLGMPIVEAARIMLKNGLPPGDTEEWSEYYSLPKIRPEYEQAAIEHERAVLAEKYQKYGVATPSALAKHVLSSEAYAEAAQKGNLASMDGYNPNDDIVEFRKLWKIYTGEPLFSKTEQFPPIKEYLAKRFPGGVPHILGGPWKGEEPLRFEEGAGGMRILRRNYHDTYWEMRPDEQDRVQMFAFGTGTTAKLFGAGDMGATEFVKAFIDAYGIPEMNAAPVRTGELERYFTESALRMGWEYTDRKHGWGIRIDENKVLTVVRLARTADTKFD